MGGALVALAVAGTLLGPAPASVSPIVFSSPGPASVLAAHRYEIGIDGSSRHELPQPDGVVSPDGRLVALVGGSETARTVEVGPFGGASTSTIAIPGTNVDPPLIAWSPDSRRLAFGVASDCYTTSYKGGGCGTHEVRVARVGADRAALVAQGRRPAWSADGRRLAFVRASGKYGGDSIFVIPAAGGRERVLAPGEYPAWAPHGSEIAYVGRRGVMVLDADRPHSKRVLSDVPLNGGPLWSPNGRLLAYLHQPIDSTKRWRLEVVDVRTRRVRLIERGAFVGPFAWSPSSRLLAYTTSQVFVAGLNGGRPRQLTHELPWAVYDAISFASRDRVDYVTHQVESDDELYAVQPDGTGLVQLTHNLVEDEEPAWSPDGTHVAFVREPNTFNPAALDVLDPATGAVRTLVTIHGFQNGVFPAWSPDGMRIAYVRGTKLAIAKADGKTVRLLATHGFPRRPTWSPDGSEIAFADGAGRELLVERTDGTGLHPVAPTSSADDAAWSPDGNWIAFSGRPTDTAENGLWLVHPDGTGFRRLASSGEPSAPAWSPDSSRLVYVSYVAGEGSTLRITAADGSSDRPLPLALTQPSWPAWGR